MLEVDKCGNDQTTNEDAIDQHQSGRLAAINDPEAKEKQAGEQLHKEVANRDGCFAVGAFAPQINPGKQRDVEIPGNSVLTARAMRAGKHNALAQRHSMNANIQKTAHHATEREEDQRPKMEWNEHPLMRIENGPNSHKYSSRERFASVQAARRVQSRFPERARPGTEACRCRWHCGSPLRVRP